MSVKTKIFYFLFGLLLLVIGILFLGVPKITAQTSQDWSNLINLSNSGVATSPILTIDSSGVAHVIWIDALEGYIYSQSSDGINWTSPKSVKFPFTKKDSPPTFVADSDGLIQVFWSNDEDVLYHSQVQSNSFDNPSTWVTKRISESVSGYDVVSDNNGTMHLAYIRNISSDINPAGIYYIHSTNSGFSWTEAINLYESDYFRSTTTADAHIRIVSDQEKVYVVWDNRPQKRIYLATSSDSGLNWEEAQSIIEPDADLGYKTPFNIEISVLDDEILLMWQVGYPGSQCVQYSRFSRDGGDQWDEPIKVLDDQAACPQKSEFIKRNKDYTIALFNIQSDLSFMAWNGVKWSEPQTQFELSNLSNPLTYDTILLRCHQVAFKDDMLYVVGCEEGGSGDIWFISRLFDTPQAWFPLPSAWSSPVVLTDPHELISSLTSVADESNVYLVWVQSLLSEAYDPSIYYSRWDGERWYTPAPVFTEPNGFPTQLSITIDNQGRLLLTWVDEKNGELLFSWSNSNRANIPIEWAEPVVLPAPSNLISSPDILVDDENRIVVVYAIHLNEGRGIYLTDSNDLGTTWSQPTQVMDAVSAGWDSVGQPKISLTADGRLHLLFTQFSVQGNNLQPIGLYYSQSDDGSSSWSEAELLSDHSVQWSEIIGHGNQIVHRLWQEKNLATIENYHQISQDGGLTWSRKNNISSVISKNNQVAITIGLGGDLHFLMLKAEDKLMLQEWIWDGIRWQSQDIEELNVTENPTQSIMTAELNPKGLLSVSIFVKYPEIINVVQNEIFNIDRLIETTNNNLESIPAVIAPRKAAQSATEIPEIQPVSTEFSSLFNQTPPSSSSNKNFVGLLIVGIVMISMIVIFWYSRKRELFHRLFPKKKHK